MNTDLMFSTGNGEWCTPRPILRAVEETFASVIDLDPASNPFTPWVYANRHYDRWDDGLAQEWRARTVFLNPPYGRHIGDWTAKAITEYQAAHYQQGILLLPARTDTRWFKPLWHWPVCFLYGRVKFIQPDRPTVLVSAPFPSVVVYLGVHILRFARAFRPFGAVRI